MKLYYNLAGTLTALYMLASCSSSNNNDSNVINVADAMDNLTELKVSQLGSKIKYIPLETTDSCLLGEKIALLANGNTVVFYPSSSRSTDVFSFDISSGRFIAKLGHPGQDPTAFSQANPALSLNGNDVYFKSHTNHLLKYSTDGTLVSDIMPAKPVVPALSVVNANTLTGACNSEMGEYAKTFYTFAPGDTIVTDSCQLLTWTTSIETPDPSEINSIDVFMVKSNYRNSPMSIGKVVMKTNIGVRNIIVPDPRLYAVGQELHYTQCFVDTIYRLESNSPATVAYAFDMGDRHAEYDDLINKEWESSYLLLTDVIENSNSVVFSVFSNAGEPEKLTYIGYFDKNSGLTTMSADGFVDDITGFGISFMPLYATSDGRLISYITIDQINEYLEDNPDAEIPAWAEGLADDANPVLVIVEP